MISFVALSAAWYRLQSQTGSSLRYIYLDNIGDNYVNQLTSYLVTSANSSNHFATVCPAQTLSNTVIGKPS